MALQLTDQFYLQRPDKGTKEYTKIKTTVNEVTQYITSGITTDYNDLSDRVDQEILDRTNGDINLALEIEQVNNRIATLGAEIYNIVIDGVFVYKIAQYCKEQYVVNMVDCDNLTNPFEYDTCKADSLEIYQQCVADNTIYNSVGGVYLVSSAYIYEDTESIFISTQDADGNSVIHEDILVGDYIEIGGIKTINDGTGQVEVVDNSNYAIYRITGSTLVSFPEAQDPTQSIYKYDVEYLNSTGSPSVSNRYQVKVMLDMERQLGKSYVKRSGDVMYGGLTISVDNIDSPINGAIEPGIQCRNRVSAMALQVTGSGIRQFPNLFPDLIFTSEDRVDIKFNTSEQVAYDYVNASSIVWKYNSQEIIHYHPADSVEQSYFLIPDKIVLNSVVEVIPAYNLSAPENNRPGVFTHKGYVDLMDDALDAKIVDINNRIDTLANASETFRYDMIVDNLIQTCTYNLDNSADPRDYVTSGLVWGNCVATEIYNQSDPQSSASGDSEFGLFSWTGPFDKIVIDEDGNDTTIEVDIVVLDGRAALYDDPTEFPNIINWANNINIGDYFEIATTALRNTAYAVYRCVDKSVTPQGQAILAGVTLFKSQENIIQGYIYKVKKYDKTSGLTLDDTEARYVKKSGDIMTGSLAMQFDAGPIVNMHTIEDKAEDPDGTIRVKYSVNTAGQVKAQEFAIRPADGSSVSGQDRAVLTEGYLQLQPRSAAAPANFYNVGSTGFKFIDGTPGTNNNRLTIKSLEISVHDSRVTLVRNPIHKQDAVTWDWLNSSYTATGKIKITQSNNGNGSLLWSVDDYSLDDLTDVDITGDPTKREQGVYLYWDKAYNYGKGAFTNSSKAIAEFKPGNQVATEDSDDPNLQQYGFYFNKSTGTLFMKV